jgi:hypothetical protein
MADRTRHTDPVNAIRRLYLEASHRTIGRDLDHAIELFKSLATDEERARAAVYMDGLSQMRSEWSGSQKRGRLRR